MIINSSIPCSGTLIPPKPVSNGCLLMLFLITRHGARSPSQDWAKKEYAGNWECGNRFNTGFWRTPIVNGKKMDIYKNNPNEVEFLTEKEKQESSSFFDLSKNEYKVAFPPSCPNGNLLDLGVDQLVDLGKLYYHYLVNTTKLLPSKFNPKNILVRSSFVPRCVESAVAIINGMYPPENNSEILNITTGQYRNEPLCPYSESTDEFVELSKEFVKKDEFKKRKEYFEKLKNLHKYLNAKLDNEMDNLVVADFLNCFRCSGNELPLPPYNEKNSNDDEVALTKNDYEQLMSNMAFWEAGFLDFAGNLSYSPIFQLILEHIDKMFSMDEQTAKFILFSGHDVSISAIMVALGYLDLIAPPPFASHLAVELWQTEKPCLRFVYNGEVLQFKGKDLTPLDEFKSIFFPK
ncbi:hypothetical protein M9Y10_005766 [Tritrichomonas musculus]|uniref:Histidine acid phosphatase family protein n=1 Tax=Tritrichomonas musculus TaxID=1915356 RepID=A0ABR2JDG0_9EUKA